MAGDGDEDGSQGRRGSERHWVRECSPPNTGLLNQRSHLSGVYVRALAPAPAFPLSLSLTLPQRSLLCTPNGSLLRAGKWDPQRPRQQWGLPQLCPLLGPFGSGQGGVPLCGSVGPVPISLARLLWLPERWLGGRVSASLGDSTLPPDSPQILSPFRSLMPVDGSLSSRLQELRSESLSLSLETTLPRAHV